LKRARVFAEKIGVDLVNVDKQRDLATGQTRATDVSGDVNGKIVVVFDDVINSGGTVVNTAELLKARGAREVHFFATHGLFANNGQEKIQNSVIDSVVVTNSVPTMPPSGSPDAHAKIHYLDSSQLFADALRPWLE
jgi:ribose-phosphate pyrophosphokinase